MKTWIALVVVAIAGAVLGISSTKHETGGLPEQFSVRQDDGYVTPSETVGKTEQYKDERIKLLDEGAPSLTFVNGQDYNFGAMNRYEIKTHSFVIRNDGGGMLELKLIDTSCRCTLSKVKKKQIPSGETADVELEWKTNDYSENFSQHATLATNDPDHPEIDLRISGKVISDVKALPEELIVARIPVNKPISVSTHVFSYHQTQMEITGHHFSNSEIADHFEVAISKLDAESEIIKAEVGATSAFDVTIALKPGLPIGSINQTLYLTTNVPGLPDLELPVRGIVEGDITPRGNLKHKFNSDTNQVYLGFVARGEELSTKMTLTVKGDFKERIKFTIDKEGIDPYSSLRAEIGEPTKLEKAWIFPLLITIPEDAHPVDRLDVDPDKNGRITIKTNHPSAPTIVIYFRFSVEG